MKKGFGHKMANFVNWFQFNIVIAFIPFILIQFMNCLLMYDVGLKDIISDYSGLCYSTSAVLLVCVMDYFKNNYSKIAQIGMAYGILVFTITTTIYGIANIYNKIIAEGYTEEVAQKIFIILTVIMVLNILAIITIKVREYFFDDKE